MYYAHTTQLEDDNSDAILSGDSNYLRRIACSFQNGLELPSEDIETPILFNLDGNSLHGKMTDNLRVLGIRGRVFSIKVKTLFARIDISNIQYYQLRLIDESFPVQVGTLKKPQIEFKTIEYTDYFIANVVGLVDCVDHEKSILEYFYPPELRNLQNEEQGSNDESNNPFAGENPNEIDFIIKLVLDESKIDPALKVFRLKDQPNLLIFHESVVEVIRKEGLSGFVFVPVSEYTDAIPDDDRKEDSKNKEDNQEQRPEQKLDLKSQEIIEELSEPKKRRLLF